MRALIIDDDAATRRLMERYLQIYGDCISAEDGFSGIAAFSAAINEGFPFQLVCLDLLLPDMDGHDVLKNIRQIEEKTGIRTENRTRIFIISGMDLPDAGTGIRGGEEGVAFIMKPVEKKKLHALLEQHKLT